MHQQSNRDFHDGADAGRGFRSDNASGIHPAVLAAIAEANIGHAPAYGADRWTADALRLLAEQFGAGSQAFLVLNGTGANVSALSAMLRPHQAVVCSTVAHLFTDECGAPTRFTGSTVLPVPAEHGLLTPDRIDASLPQSNRGEHQVVPAVLSLTNATELGTVYRPDQVADLAEWAHSRGMLVHMDGARLANAAVSARSSLTDVSIAAGVDVLTFGGTKNGLLLGEAVVFAGTAAGLAMARDFRYIRKQSAQLASKMRFVAAQFVGLLNDELWRRNATAANAAATYLGQQLSSVAGVQLVHPVQANSVFATMPPAIALRLRKDFGANIWEQSTGVVRLVCSFDTSPNDVDGLVAAARSTSGDDPTACD
ncbi:threonine aldolase [Rhodococcus sp. ABRD24]|uniref:threonine aldolase family protein n=1 Tax=Rhodococcus sp. ABRD24 TaxID=2507582 RepID=UPI00103A09CE|nr:beta-eliminating lyase-related protein [Rhodococcus sp. ABRD24]QBJ95895.1 threonine aldolase [Rhodococcus sp. ABRD24]